MEMERTKKKCLRSALIIKKNAIFDIYTEREKHSREIRKKLESWKSDE